MLESPVRFRSQQLAELVSRLTAYFVGKEGRGYSAVANLALVVPDTVHP